MLEKTTSFYSIYHTPSDTLFETSSGKVLWRMRSHAKAAWLNSRPYRYRPKHFDDQQDYVVVEVCIVPKTRLGKLQDNEEILNDICS